MTKDTIMNLLSFGIQPLTVDVSQHQCYCHFYIFSTSIFYIAAFLNVHIYVLFLYLTDFLLIIIILFIILLLYFLFMKE